MFRTIDDFARRWSYESEATLKVLRNLTAGSLAQPVSPGGRTLGRLAWHVVTSVTEMASHAGLPADVPDEAAPPPALEEMISVYERSSKALVAAVNAEWTDALLLAKIPMYGEEWPRGEALFALVAHQAHHRGQMTVLMRQAGLKVPGVYGPALEEWAAFGMPAQS
jgi:uncharacterized damage-inducible protein DinB